MSSSHSETDMVPPSYSPSQGDGHHDLLQGSVARPLADAVDGALQLPRAAQGACGDDT